MRGFSTQMSLPKIYLVRALIADYLSYMPNLIIALQMSATFSEREMMVIERSATVELFFSSPLSDSLLPS